jgi:lipopolysaccharide/colanic/teichoic acid biosynthesis glycosyltransferase
VKVKLSILIKRLFDFGVALFGLIILSPVMFIIASVIRFTSPGPILFIQNRVGLGGRIFKIYKFRSMVVNAEKLGTSVTTAKDQRITPVGRFLRKTKLDELPQLWNVLRGDMSFVGPRPDVPEIIETYTPQMRQILNIRPGITSNATLYLRDEEEILARYPDPDAAYLHILVPLKVELAMEHGRRNSFWYDLRILIQTVLAVVMRGVYQPQLPESLRQRLAADNLFMEERNKAV